MSKKSYYDVLKELADVSDLDNPPAKTLVSLFEDERFKRMSIEHQLQYIGISSVILSIAIEAKDDKKFSWEALNVASKLMHPLHCDVFNSLYLATASYIAHSQGSRLEYYYHDLFNKHIEKIFNCKVAKHVVDRRNIPDAWVKYNGEEIPVEIKRGDFNDSALRQLKRYMRAYKTSTGMAVGRDYTAKYCENVIFIPTSYLDYCEQKEK